MIVAARPSHDQQIIRVLELRVEVLADNALAVRLDVDTQLGHVGYLILSL